MPSVLKIPFSTFLGNICSVKIEFLTFREDYVDLDEVHLSEHHGVARESTAQLNACVGNLSIRAFFCIVLARHRVVLLICTCCLAVCNDVIHNGYKSRIIGIIFEKVVQIDFNAVFLAFAISVTCNLFSFVGQLSVDVVAHTLRIDSLKGEYVEAVVCHNSIGIFSI